MNLLAIERRLLALKHPIISQHRSNAQLVILKHIRSSLRLCSPMFFKLSPGCNSLLIAPEREREQLAGLSQALEALDGEKAINLLKQRPQARRNIKILLSVPILWTDFKNDGDHRDNFLSYCKQCCSS